MICGPALALSGLLALLGLVADLASATQSQSAERRREMTAEERERVRKATAAVGLILIRRTSDSNPSPRPRGSAVIARKDGVVATNLHVVAEDKSDRVYDEIYLSLPAEVGVAPQTSNVYRLEVVLVNKAYDLVLLRVKSDGKQPATEFPVIEMGDSKSVKLLDDLIVIGFPEKGGSTITVNTGLIEGTDVLGNWIKTDARLIHGNSGGAAVNSEGKLIGIPTRVVADRQPVDRDGDGFPDDYRWLGAVGFLRPSHLVEGMLAQLRETESKTIAVEASNPERRENVSPALPESPRLVVRGIVKSAADSKPIAGARVGLTPLGSGEVTASNLLTWGGTNAEGQFTLNNPVPPGRYTLKAKAINYEALSLDVEIDQKTEQLTVELRPSQ
jgi:S1-C subfamily serine protease